jgi:enoyl-CoA hydratase/carnithine racemase
MRRDFVFDDGGMNLLSSSALRAIGGFVTQWSAAALGGASSSASDAAEGGGAPPSLFVFRSGRPGLFAAGADMAEMQRFTAFEAERFARLGQELFAEIERLPCITVALIDGDCFGGALDLALAFDLRFATPRSRFAHPGGKIGIVTGFGGTSRWRKVLTTPAAHQLFLANRTIGAAEAMAIGLVDRVDESHEAELSRLASLDPATTQVVKQLTSRAERLSRQQLLLLAERLGQLYSAS